MNLIQQRTNGASIASIKHSIKNQLGGYWRAYRFSMRIPVKVATCSNPNLPLIPAESSPPIPVGVVASENQPNFD